MLGDVRQRQGQMDTAARAYIDAIRAVPDGQSAYLALAQILTALRPARATPRR